MRIHDTGVRALVAVGAVAAVLAVSGCGPAGDRKDETAQPSPTASAPQSPEAAAPTQAPTDSPAPSTSEDPFADSARATSWASDEAMKIDKDGNGTIPAASLEADLVDLFKNKFDMSVKEAKCDQDMTVTQWSGFESCNVVDEKMTYFGTIELIDHKDSMVKYEVMLPGIDKSDVDF